jgi:hypothetical protein
MIKLQNTIDIMQKYLIINILLILINSGEQFQNTYDYNLNK